ncbi:SMP-30/gluconolactonase/LRE family protein [Candidatus Peregrinibacteria bacterium]|nr:SMP-30/gluconolactonase/LRE family protein [Candidatus Peregrinibacteria bacterium]
MTKKAEVVFQQATILGEGALWYVPGQVLYWLDISGQCVFIYDPATEKNRTIDIGHDVGAIVPRTSGGVMLAIKGGFASLDFDTAEVKEVAMVESHLPGNRFNDGKCDPAGRFWAGSMAYDFSPGAASLYYLDTDLSVRRVMSGVTISNGLVWTQDTRTFYYIDSGTSQISVYDYDKESGNICNRRVVVEVPTDVGLLDGMSIDGEGMLWVAMYRAGTVCCWDPLSGNLLEKIEVPCAKLVTSCAFGGADLDELYITTASKGLSDEEKKEQPLAGSLFKVKLDVKGAPTWEFAG